MYKRLKELREMHGLTQTECAKKVFISKNSYIRYEKGERMLPLDVAIFLADLYNVSIDYIAGLTEKPERSYKTKKQGGKEEDRDVG